MSWTTIFTVLGLAGATAFLVFIEQWSYETALGTMLGVAFALIAVLTAVIYLLMPVDSRARVFTVIKVETMKELKVIMNAIWKKRP